jgi:hypothetical protein
VQKTSILTNAGRLNRQVGHRAGMAIVGNEMGSAFSRIERAITEENLSDKEYQSLQEPQFRSLR